MLVAVVLVWMSGGHAWVLQLDTHLTTCPRLRRCSAISRSDWGAPVELSSCPSIKMRMLR